MQPTRATRANIGAYQICTGVYRSVHAYIYIYYIICIRVYDYNSVPRGPVDRKKYPRGIVY